MSNDDESVVVMVFEFVSPSGNRGVPIYSSTAAFRVAQYIDVAERGTMRKSDITVRRPSLGRLNGDE